MKSLRAEALNVLLCFILGASMGGAILLSSSRSPPLPSDEATITGGDPGMEALQSIRDPVLRRHALFNVMSRLAVNDLPAALALLPHDDSRETLLVEWIEQRLLKQRPDIGAQAATAIRNEARCHQWLLKCLPGWRLRDDAKAAQWLRSVLTDSLAQAVADHAINDDPAFAARALLSRELALASLLKQWLVYDPEEALRFMETMPGTAFHPAMLKGSVSSLLAIPGARLSVWLGALSSATREAMGLELVPQLSALITTDAACEWLNASGLLKANPVVVTKWFEQLAALAPDIAERELAVIEERDAAVIGLLRAVGQREREAAFAWLPQIHDSKLRAAEAQSQWIAWAHEDRVAALAWFTSEEALGLLDSSSRATLTKIYAVQL